MEKIYLCLLQCLTKIPQYHYKNYHGIFLREIDQKLIYNFLIHPVLKTQKQSKYCVLVKPIKQILKSDPFSLLWSCCLQENVSNSSAVRNLLCVVVFPFILLILQRRVIRYMMQRNRQVGNFLWEKHDGGTNFHRKTFTNNLGCGDTFIHMSWLCTYYYYNSRKVKKRD